MTYEYECSSCGHQWEARQKISDAALTDCPTCQQATAKRLISRGASFQLKGGGWYADGYSSVKAEGKESSSSSSGGESKASSSSSSD